jgi:hypothetical protein
MGIVKIHQTSVARLPGPMPARLGTGIHALSDDGMMVDAVAGKESWEFGSAPFLQQDPNTYHGELPARWFLPGKDVLFAWLSPGMMFCPRLGPDSHYNSNISLSHCNIYAIQAAEALSQAEGYPLV